MAATPTLTGQLTRWEDDRGFGFITPLDGGADVFLHISAVPRTAARPQQGDLLNYSIERAEDGKRRATRVELVRTTSTAARPPRAPSSRPRAAGVLTALASAAVFFAALLVQTEWWSLPQWVAVWYLATSILCFIVYSVDKSAAVAGRWRTPESTLLGLGLIAGWPGALVAQQVLRHKLRKSSYMSAFAGTVVANLAVLVLVATPLGERALCVIADCG
ncbi:uncharacterized membrane protein YsdA (DUF1294 family)/cold shock CspA family protein [Okibacterium sp. HSC-33S16]|uniref:DUF1294 domain-containing protein n=1 Tax=Okibacterium sp. HSC-33S16 TaxID=2910965 RepID=UPI00209FC22E|nr:cold shock and DUF1294 domain-containing protein [Okibacterium sp. HSC-33S16]MCP2032403.1 uncharacterized membrane protein YsdA (DUF1294 family)/cold shock CspA family protein [Okibacterium sp. HSC-33S16]